MATTTVYHLQYWSKTEERPRIDFELPTNGLTIPWMEVARVVYDDTPAFNYAPIRLLVEAEDADQWHSFNIAGTYGLLSKFAVDLIGQYMTRYFEFLEAWINDLPFYLLRKKQTIDCLDRKNSVVIPFPSEPGSIMRIERFQFHKEMIPDPAVFAIPELRGELFATQSIKLIVEAARLKGLYFREIENGPW